TSLSKEALPIIRYNTHDLSRLLPPTSRAFRRMEKITGRSDDMLIIRGVNVFPTQIEEIICRQEGLAPHYFIEVSREGNLDKFALTVEWDAKRPADSDETAVLGRLKHEIKTFTGITSEIKLSAAGTLERSIGKAKHVLDNRK